MKLRTKIFSFIILFIVPFSSFSQTANELIKKHIEALGGQKNWESVESMKISGKYTAYSKTTNFTDYKYKDEKYYSDRFEGKGKVYEGYSGKTAWKREDWEGVTSPRKVNDKELNVIKQKTEICTPFFNYQKKGYTVEFIGKEDFEGTEVYVLKLIRSNEKTETWYLDAKTFLHFKQESEWSDSGWPAKSEAYFDDFREVSGVLVPFYTERTFSTRYRVTEIEKVEINVKVDESIFEMPKSKEIQKLSFMEGDWDVKIDVFSRRGTWYPLGSYSSKVDFSGTNIIRENINYERITPVSKTRFYTFSSLKNKYEIAVLDDNSSSVKIFQGNFSDTLLTADNIKSIISDGIQDKAVFDQYCIYSIKKDSFILEVKRSNDKGKTWENRDKFTYTRKK